MRGWSAFGAQTNHNHTRTHNTHHSLDLGEATTFPLLVLFVFGHAAYTLMSFCLEIFEIGTTAILEAHNSFYRLPIEVMSKAKL
jgi:hypothetical protein